MVYERLAPTGAILRVQDWFDSMSRDEADHSILLDVIQTCAWPPRISGAYSKDKHFRLGIEIELPKPNQNRENEIGRTTSLTIDPEGLGLLMLYGLGGGHLSMQSRGDGKFHYLVVAFPGEPTSAVHRLIVDAASDHDVRLLDHHDYRRQSLGGNLTLDQQRQSFGHDRVRTRSRETRKSTIEMAVKHLHRTEMSRLVPENEYRAMFAWGYRFLNDLPLGQSAASQLTCST